MLWIVSLMDVSFGTSLRVPIEDYSRYAGYGIGGDLGFRYFFTDRFGVGLSAGAYYHFQKRHADSIGGVWVKQNTQTNVFPASLNLLMNFYLAEGISLLISVGGGGNYAMYRYDRRVGIYDSTTTNWKVREEDGTYKVAGYLINFESAFRMTDFDVFMGVNILQTEINRVDMLTGKEKVEKSSYPVLYLGVRYYIKFGV